MDQVKAEIAVRTNQKLSNPELLNDICLHVANGGSLVDLCAAWEVRYSDIVMWIYADVSRKDTYESAIKAQGQWMITRLLAELREISTVDIRKAFNANGGLLPIQEIPREVAACIASIESVELFEGRGEDREQIGDLKKVKFWDKLKSIELLGKNLSMFIDRHEHEVKFTLEDMITGSQDPPTASQAPPQIPKQKTIEVRAEEF